MFTGDSGGHFSNSSWPYSLGPRLPLVEENWFALTTDAVLVREDRQTACFVFSPGPCSREHSQGAKHNSSFLQLC